MELISESGDTTNVTYLRCPPAETMPDEVTQDAWDNGTPYVRWTKNGVNFISFESDGD